MHFFQAKEWLVEKINAELPISDDELELMLLEEKELSVIDDEPHRWCLRYAQYMEADRYLSQEEKAMSIFNIYMAIVEKDETSLESVFNALRETNDAAGTRLMFALNEFLEEKEAER